MDDFASIIVNEARSWLGTPYHHQARLKGKGCDCLGLAVGIADELGLEHSGGARLSIFDEPNYSHQPDSSYFITKLQEVLVEVPKEDMAPGDLGLFAIQGNPQHVAIFSQFLGELGMIHSFAPARKVVEHRVDKEWHSKLVKVFRWQPSY